MEHLARQANITQYSLLYLHRNPSSYTKYSCRVTHSWNPSQKPTSSSPTSHLSEPTQTSPPSSSKWRYPLESHQTNSLAKILNPTRKLKIPSENYQLHLHLERSSLKCPLKSWSTYNSSLTSSRNKNGSTTQRNGPKGSTNWRKQSRLTPKNSLSDYPTLRKAPSSQVPLSTQPQVTSKPPKMTIRMTKELNYSTQSAK